MNQNDLAHLLRKCRALKLDEEDLDEVVHEIHDKIAAAINNDGLEAQIRTIYTSGEYGVAEIEKMLDEIAAGKHQVAS